MSAHKPWVTPTPRSRLRLAVKRRCYFGSVAKSRFRPWPRRSPAPTAAGCQARAQVEGDLKQLQSERRGLERDLTRYHAELRKLAADSSPRKAARMADLQDLVARAETRLAEVRQQVAERQKDQLDDQEVAATFGDFDTVWNSLSPREQAEALALLAARVEYDGANSQIAVSFHPSAIGGFAQDRCGEKP